MTDDRPTVLGISATVWTGAAALALVAGSIVGALRGGLLDSGPAPERLAPVAPTLVTVTSAASPRRVTVTASAIVPRRVTVTSARPVVTTLTPASPELAPARPELTTVTSPSPELTTVTSASPIVTTVTPASPVVTTVTPASPSQTGIEPTVSQTRYGTTPPASTSEASNSPIA